MGRWHLPVGTNTPIYTLKKKRLDYIGGDTRRMQEDELAGDSDEEDTRGGRSKKPKKKKITKAFNLSNMGNFRNKDFGAGKSKGATKGKGKGKKGADDDE